MQKVTSICDDDANEQGTTWKITGVIEGVGRVDLYKEKPTSNSLTWLEWCQAVDSNGQVYWYQEDL